MVKRTIVTLSVVAVVAISLTACSSNKDDTAANQTDQHQNMNGNMNHDQMAKNGNATDTMGHDHMAKTADGKLIYYTCPMPAHKNVHSDQPGNCPECGMKLVEAVVTDSANAQYWGCPMPSHSHVRMEKAGDCPECGMKLKPMKLVKN